MALNLTTITTNHQCKDLDASAQNTKQIISYKIKIQDHTQNSWASQIIYVSIHFKVQTSLLDDGKAKISC